jgi:hypothetical protein
MRRCTGVVLVLATLCGLAAACGRSDADSGRSVSPGGFAFTNLTIARPTVWLCRPDLVENPCEDDLDATVVERDFATRLERFEPAGSPPLDCFYVYPTVFAPPGDNAPLRADAPQIRIARTQAARFAETCRVFAPVYRQYTHDPVAPAAGERDGDGRSDKAVATAYSDVVSAWHDYLANDNAGRGVVLVGHGQGASHLARLLREEIEKDRAQRTLLVSALLVGANVTVAAGRDTGGDFAAIPACRSHDQVRCVVAYSVYDGVPPREARFGRLGAHAVPAGRPLPHRGEVLCTNPAALGGGSAPLHPYLPTRRLADDQLAGLPSATLPDRPSAFVTYPHLLSAYCRNEGGAAWLELDVESLAGDTRALPATTQPASWGLHALDVSLALGDLVRLVQRQAVAWTASADHRPS